MIMPDGGEIFGYEEVKEDVKEESLSEVIETVDEFVDSGTEIKPDLTDAVGELSDADVGTDEETQSGELPNYDTPVGAEETWQSKYESLGLCYNVFSSCKVVAASSCWFINEMNGSKPDTLAFLDPSLEKIDIALEGGPSDVSETLEFIRVDEGAVMDNGFFDSAIWLVGDVQIAADYVGETIDVLFTKVANDPDTGSCEYVYNYPCPDDDICNP